MSALPPNPVRSVYIIPILLFISLIYQDMMTERQATPHFFTQVDACSSLPVPEKQDQDSSGELCTLMREMLAAQDRQNELLEELVVQIGSHHRQRMAELSVWQQANPELAHFCRRAADKLGKIQTDYLTSITEEIEYGFETLRGGEYVLSEFVDRFGPRFAHLNGLLHVLSQLGSPSDVTDQSAGTRSAK